MLPKLAQLFSIDVLSNCVSRAHHGSVQLFGPLITLLTVASADDLRRAGKSDSDRTAAMAVPINWARMNPGTWLMAIPEKVVV
ncbi:MAG: hypothetical protein WB537_18130, partial [Pseudolabrys sp.]